MGPLTRTAIRGPPVAPVLTVQTQVVRKQMTQLIEKMPVKQSQIKGGGTDVFMIQFGDDPEELTHVSVSDDSIEALIEMCGAITESTFSYYRILRMDVKSGVTKTIFEGFQTVPPSAPN